MLTPRGGSPGWSPKMDSRPLPLAEEIEGSSHVAMPVAATRGRSEGITLVEGPPHNLLDINGEILATRGEHEIWRRFREAGSLIGASPIVGPSYKIINDEGGVAGESIGFFEFGKMVENRCPIEASMTFYEFGDRHGKVSHSDICNHFLLFLFL